MNGLIKLCGDGRRNEEICAGILAIVGHFDDVLLVECRVLFDATVTPLGQ